jgi:transposase
MIHAGADVHVRNTFYAGTDSDGQVLKRGRCANRLDEVAAFFAPLERRSRDRGEAMRMVMESTTNSRAMRNLLLEYGRASGIDLTVDVLDARKLRVIAESVNKSDRIDAGVLCELCRSNLKLPACYMPDDEEFALREHLRARHDLVRMRTMLKNRVHAVFHRRGILTPTGDLFTLAGRAFMDQATLDDAGRAIVDRYLRMMDQLQTAIAESTASLKELKRRPRWMKPAALLETMPGIGLITSLTILAELGDLRRFRGRAAVANYAGLTPRVRRSNETTWTGGISRRGSNHLRAMLVEAAWMGKERVPVYQSLYARIQGKSDARKAIVAVARRMLEDAWTMLRKDEAFRYVGVSAVKAPEASAPQGGEGASRSAVKGRAEAEADASVVGRASAEVNEAMPPLHDSASSVAG